VVVEITCRTDVSRPGVSVTEVVTEDGHPEVTGRFEVADPLRRGCHAIAALPLLIVVVAVVDEPQVPRRITPDVVVDVVAEVGIYPERDVRAVERSGSAVLDLIPVERGVPERPALPARERGHADLHPQRLGKRG